MKKLLLTYSKYNLWANERICSFLDKLEPSLFDKQQSSSFSTIRDTLNHIYGAESIWYRRLHGESPAKLPDDGSKTDYGEFRKIFLKQSRKLTEYINGMSKEKMKNDFAYKNIEGKKFKNSIYLTLQHVFNHSTFHRGQLVTMLRNVGFTNVSSTDFISYVRESET